MRNRTVDIARGALIFYIVTIIHGVFWLNLLSLPFNSLLLFEMPLIFMVSGYAYALFEQNKDFVLTAKSYAFFVASRGTRILLPFFVYALISALWVIQQTGSESAIATLMAWLNPITYGRGHSLEMLNWHLWFIWPFLLVTLLFPLFIKLYPPRIPLWVTTIGLGLLLIVLPLLQRPTRQWQTAVFYLFWFYVGYKLANGLVLKRQTYLILAVGGTAVLLLAGFLLPVTLDMQANKFPPNSLFLLFSVVWVALFFLFFTYINPRKFDFLASSHWFKPFITSGYSIYLWQGVGYTAAVRLIAGQGVSIYLTWILAILLTAVLGILFSPLERIRL
ncbi:MAG: acyltransferase family protein [Chloroflexota bacterium]